jgi:hypothetical protein
MDGLLSDAGFHPIAFFEDSPAIHGARSLIRSFAWRMLSALLRLAALVETGEGASIVSRNFLTVAHRSTCRE